MNKRATFFVDCATVVNLNDVVNLVIIIIKSRFTLALTFEQISPF